MHDRPQIKRQDNSEEGQASVDPRRPTSNSFPPALSMTSPKEQVRWLPLESNPESFNYWATALGLPTRSSSSLSPNSNDPPAFSNQNETLWVFRDCVGLDNDSLASIPQPVKVRTAVPFMRARADGDA